MHDWLTIELVLGTLLVTSFTCVGLVALWAATSPRHWFIRTAVVLAALAPLLAVPAYEPFLALSLQACVIVAGVQIWPWVKRSRFKYAIAVQAKSTERNRPHPLHFALRMLLLATPAVAVLALLSPFVGFAYAPIAVFLVFALEACAILAGAQIWSWVRRIRFRRVDAGRAESAERSGRPAYRFSLKTLLLITPLVAVITAIATRIATHLGRQSVESWTTIGLLGVAAGGAVLLAAWVAASERKWIVCPIAIALCLCLAGTLAWFDWLFYSIAQYGGRPPSAPPPASPFETHPQLAWFGVLPASMLAVFALLILWRIGFRPEVRVTSRREGVFRHIAWPSAAAYIGFAFLFLVCAVPPTAILWKLLNPLTFPDVTISQTNGYADVVSAGSTMSLSPILNMSVDPTSTAALATEVSKYSAAYEQLRLALKREIHVPVWPDDGDLLNWFNTTLNDMDGLRFAAQGLVREAELAQQEKRYGDAAKISLDIMQLGQSAAHGGLLTHYVFGIAIERIGDVTFYETLSYLDADKCREMIATLSRIETGREPLDAVLYRDRIWSQRSVGWVGHLLQILEDIAQASNSADLGKSTLQRKQAVTRLLIVELALRAYLLEHGALPNLLTELTPEFLEQAPIDPFDPDGQPLRYVRTPDGYVLYSVGSDGKDNQGRATDWDSGLWNDGEDLCLDFFLAPVTNVPAANPSATSTGAGSNAAESDAAVDDGGE